MRREEKSVVAGKSLDFAVRIVKLCSYLCDEKQEHIMSKQLLRSGTSIGANVKEALYAQSDKDFLSKMSIALKEASETEYWLELLKRTEYLTEEQYKSVYNDCIEILKLLISITGTLKKTANR